MDNRWDNLSMSEKNQLLGIYASKGYTDLASIINHYNSFATGGQMNTDGSKEDKNNKTYRTKQPLQEVNITTDRPTWQRGLTDYDWSRARQYYSDENGYITPQGFAFLKNVASKRRTGKSDFMRDVNKLSYIPNAAMLGAGALSGAAFNPYLWTAVGLASGAQNIEDKNYKEAALDLGLTLGIPAAKPIVKMINTAVESTKFGKAARTAAEINKATRRIELSATPIENTAHSRVILNNISNTTPTLDQAYQESLLSDALTNKSNQLLEEYYNVLNTKNPNIQKLQEIVDEYGNTQYKLQTGNVNIIPEYLRNIKRKSHFGDISTLDFYHGSDVDFNIFDPRKSDEMYFFSPYENFAKGFGKNVKRYRLFASELEPHVKSEDLYKLMGQKDNAMTKGIGDLEFVIGHPSRIKSGEPIVYDNDGKVIPLENRFLFYNWDIRHKLGGLLK